MHLLHKLAELVLLQEQTLTMKLDMLFLKLLMVQLLNMLVLIKLTHLQLFFQVYLLLEHLGWNEAANMIIKSVEKTIASKVVTYDFARLMEGATEVKSSEFADELIKNLNN